MTCSIDGVEFDLSNPINKYWYSKFKKSILKNNVKISVVTICTRLRYNRFNYIFPPSCSSALVFDSKQYHDLASGSHLQPNFLA